MRDLGCSGYLVDKSACLISYGLISYADVVVIIWLINSYQSGQETLLIETKNPRGFELLSIALVEKTQKFITDNMGIQIVVK